MIFRAGYFAELAQWLLRGSLPQQCVLCQQPSGVELICQPCTQSLPTFPTQKCPRCWLPTLQGEICGSCLQTPLAFDEIRAAFPYAFPVDQLIRRLKYSHQLYLTTWLGRQLLAVIQQQEILPDYIVPLPLARSHQVVRGFNQAAELARVLSRQLDIPLRYDLQRIKEGLPQTQLSGEQRYLNVRDAYAVPVDAQKTLQGRHVAVVDDVLTTGASLSEAAKALKATGVREVSAWVVARTMSVSGRPMIF